MVAACPDRGAVTVEAAIALSALVVVLSVLLAGLVAVGDQLRCTDAAGEAARLIARGQRQSAEQAMRSLAPGGARMTVHSEADGVSVEVVAPVAGLIPGFQVRADAYAALEPGVEAGT